MSSKIERKKIALNLRHYGPQPRICVRSFSAITNRSLLRKPLTCAGCVRFRCKDDTAGELLPRDLNNWAKQLNESEASGLSMRFSIEPAHQSNDIHGSSHCQMLKMRPFLANGTGTT